jgi:hypothetical protein
LQPIKRIFLGVIFAFAFVAAMIAADYETLARSLTDQIVGQAFDKVVAQFDARMAAALPLEKVQSIWSNLLGQVGEFKSIERVEIKAVPDHPEIHLVELRCVFEKATLLERVAFNDDNKIVGLSFVTPPAP